MQQEESAFKGLSEQEVIRSRQEHGANLLTPPKRKSAWRLFLEKFKDPIIRILLAALILTVGVALYQYGSGEEGAEVFFEPTGIFVALILATVIGFLVEQNANKKFEILNQVDDDAPVKVIRQGGIREIPRKDVVVGDIVALDAGEEIPADGKLVKAVSLQVNESTLTGEPIISKTTDQDVPQEEATYPPDMVLKGTTVVGGHGIFKVEAVGDATEYGQVYVGSQIQNNTETPLNKQLERLGKMITWASFTIAVVLVIVRMVFFFTRHPDSSLLEMGKYILQTFMIAITLIVVSVPEGLPMSIVLSLALSMKRMLATNNLVRKMDTCETMGAVSVICTDKTGTLTKNQMRVYQADFPIKNQKDGQEIIRESIALNSTAFLDTENPEKIKALGNPTEGALLLWLRDQQVNYLELRKSTRIIGQIPFSTERKYMATLVDSPVLKQKMLYVKGAPEIVFGLCTHIHTEEGIKPVGRFKEALQKKLLAYQKQAMRTLGFAYQAAEREDLISPKNELEHTDLIFLGIAAISDPVREDAPEAIRQCMDAGISIKIVTGDTAVTATEIGRQVGLWLPTDTDRNRITGPEFSALSDVELLERLSEIKIISRARPLDKERLVKLLQHQGEVVAVTGDGTNDAPALNAAQVGLSMGDGTTVAKEASAITILDNSFHSITRAVMWGRSLYQNIQRFILFQLTVNVVACLIILIGAFLGSESPLAITQILWVNIIMDTFAALALASLPPNEKVMRNKPRKMSDFIITRKMGIQIIAVGSIFVTALIGLLHNFRAHEITAMGQIRLIDMLSGISSTKGNTLSPYELTLFFTVFVMLQFWNLFNAKAFETGKSAFRDLADNKIFWGVCAVILLGQVLIVNFGGRMFNVTPISWNDWLSILLQTSLVLWIGEFYRWMKGKTKAA